LEESIHVKALSFSAPFTLTEKNMNPKELDHKPRPESSENPGKAVRRKSTMKIG
jgi:hypothetical protein